jgi:putative nucleotidyltransferase with HDIG domain
MNRWLYRARQFFEALAARPTPEDLQLAEQTLTAAQFSLFRQMQLSDQAHAVQVLRRVKAQCQARGFDAPADLQVAALLHDVGKARYPLSIWERVMIVLGKAILPARARAWGAKPPRGWARPFVVAANHPGWGAEMAADRGTPPRTVALIRRHQDTSSNGHHEEDVWLEILQAVDDDS